MANETQSAKPKHARLPLKHDTTNLSYDAKGAHPQNIIKSSGHSKKPKHRYLHSSCKINITKLYLFVQS
jgi:hypothetical protein